MFVCFQYNVVYLSDGQRSCPAVNYITPSEASTEGGSAIMIFGCGKSLISLHTILLFLE